MNDKYLNGELVAAPGMIYEYEEIFGSLNAGNADTKTAFPKLTAISGSLYTGGADTKTAFPKLAAIGGSLYTGDADTKTAFPKLTAISGSLYAGDADTKTAFPKLTAIGGSLYAGGRLKNVKANDLSDVETCRDILFSANLENGYYFVDGILSKIVNRKGRVARVIICGKTDVSYIVNDGTANYSHGATLNEARAGLIYKLSSRDTTEFKTWTHGTIVTLSDAIKAYRAITGACEAGTRHFCEHNILPKKMSVAEAIKLTNGQYGSDIFSKFFGAAR